MKRLYIALATVLVLGITSVTAHAGLLNISLSGSFPNYTFSESTLGTVYLLYSSTTEKSGVSTQFAEPVLVIGNTGNESMTMSWSNSVTSLNLEHRRF